MKRKLVTGLVGAGAVSRSFLTRMPELLRRLGPVKATSFRVARRIANSLRAGEAVSGYQDLDSCDLIWVAAPDASLDRVVAELAAGTKVNGTMIVLCESSHSSLWPRPLLNVGAMVASLNVVEESQERMFVAEGHPDTLYELRRLASIEKRKLIEISPPSKALYFAGIRLATDLLLPWIAGAVESLRAAGFSRAEAASLAHALGARALRGYEKAGRQAGQAATIRGMRRSLERDMEGLRLSDPKLAALYALGIEQASRYFGDSP